MRLVTFKTKIHKADRATKQREYRAAYEARNPGRWRTWYLAHRELCIRRAGENKRRKKVDLQTVWKVAA